MRYTISRSLSSLAALFRSSTDYTIHAVELSGPAFDALVRELEPDVAEPHIVQRLVVDGLIVYRAIER